MFRVQGFNSTLISAEIKYSLQKEHHLSENSASVSMLSVKDSWN